jgi:hypothetical protein
MATGFANQFTAATTTSFQQKVAIALVNQARQVKTESPNGTVAKNRARQALADRVLADPGSASSTGWTPGAVTVAVAYALATLGQDDSTVDATLSTTIASAWDAIAGYSTSQD